MAPPSVPSVPPLLTAAPAAIPPAVPMVSAFVAQPPRPTSDATSAIPIPDLIMCLCIVELNCTESIGAPMRTTVGDGLLRLVTPLLDLVALPNYPEVLLISFFLIAGALTAASASVSARSSSAGSSRPQARRGAGRRCARRRARSRRAGRPANTAPGGGSRPGRCRGPCALVRVWRLADAVGVADDLDLVECGAAQAIGQLVELRLAGVFEGRLAEIEQHVRRQRDFP